MPVVPKSSIPTAPALPAVDPTYLAMAAGQMEEQGRLFYDPETDPMIEGIFGDNTGAYKPMQTDKHLDQLFKEIDERAISADSGTKIEAEVISESKEQLRDIMRKYNSGDPETVAAVREFEDKKPEYQSKQFMHKSTGWSLFHSLTYKNAMSRLELQPNLTDDDEKALLNFEFDVAGRRQYTGPLKLPMGKK